QYFTLRSISFYSHQNRSSTGIHLLNSLNQKRTVMKKMLLSSAVLLFSIMGHAQVSGQPNTQLPAPKTKSLAQADLQVTELSLVSVQKNAGTKRLTIRVSVTIKNNGNMKAGTSYLKAFFKNAGISKAIEPPKSIRALNPGESFTEEYVFERGYSSDTGYTLTTFEFWVRADFPNIVKESNEVNNGSAVINITPPTN
ncbi:MAG TPA: CARDB domain-containing protein, partial [Chitinophagaceae bacterium]